MRKNRCWMSDAVFICFSEDFSPFGYLEYSLDLDLFLDGFCKLCLKTRNKRSFKTFCVLCVFLEAETKKKINPM